MEYITKQRYLQAYLIVKRGLSKKMMLEYLFHENVWEPPILTEDKIDNLLDEAPESTPGHLVIFQIEPYVDSLYIEYDSANQTIQTMRFTFHEGYAWTKEEEADFENKCLQNEKITYTYAAIDPIFKFYSAQYPEWHLKRYYTKGIRILDHIYHCMKRGSAKEILYKSGLDELAAAFFEIDEFDLLASKPSELFDGISIRTLRALNCKSGAWLLHSAEKRLFVKELQRIFPDFFKNTLNDAQASYLNRMIEMKLTPGEAGRLFRAKQAILSAMWCNSQYDLFLLKEKVYKENLDSASDLGRIDPIYKKYIEEERLEQKEILTLRRCLLQERSEWDTRFRRANRKRKAEWQEREKGYVVRFPQTINDFCKEAVYMSNCLLGYIDAYADNITDILFIRKSNDINQPFITMEIYKNSLYQAYHRFNEDCTPEEAEWIREYCERHSIDHERFQFNKELDQLW